ncbi:MAG: hypothetical protein DI603_15210 [Roseateles depolymerans]|uniref:Uncharacterized protein n=1 Tax=Roseateles depolymerans TaxID=76731 RepID=A0A2W5DPQ0_9BURK|nr:MAG: hypothetical protein DI603_15210 [Roseateles depolymerans]
MLTPHDLSLKPRGHQVAMAGDDWLSDRDRKAQTRAEAERKKAALTCTRKLQAAAEALNDYLAACNLCNDGSGNERTSLADSRVRLVGDLMEYAGWLDSKYGKAST